MNQKRAAITLKVIVWALFIISPAASFLWLLWDPSLLWTDVWALAYLPVDIAYFSGAIYLAANFEKVIRTHRVQLIKAIVGLFIVDILYGLFASTYQILVPESKLARTYPATTSEIIMQTGIGVGVGLLITFALIQLINIASGLEAKTPPKWQTIGAWAIVACIVVGTVLYATFS